MIGMGGGMQEVRDHVLRAGGTASLATAAVWDRVFRAGVLAGSEIGGRAEWRRRWGLGHGVRGTGRGGTSGSTVVMERVTRMLGSSTLGCGCSTLCSTLGGG